MRRAMPILGLAAVVLAAAGVGLIALDRPVSASLELRPQDADLVALGEKVYAAECAVCHGADLGGQANWRERRADGRLPAPPHDESGHTWHHPDAQLIELTKRGIAAMVGGGYESDMPAYENVLSDEEIVAVLSYIKSRWPDEVRRQHDMINRRTKETQ